MDAVQTELRCAHKLHAILKDEGIIEVACRSAFCGYKSGVVVLHRFSIETGELLETRKFKNPSPRKGHSHGSE